MKLKWDRTTISASEVNRYTYCPYQWYFERYYGRSILFQMSKTKKAEPALKKSKTTEKTADKKRESHLARGRAYHAKEYENFKRQQKIVWAILILIAVIIVACVILFLIK